MGQAFDESGNVLGEAYGDTKREVFEKLNEAHPNAAEMRIKSITEQVEKAGESVASDQGDGASGEETPDQPEGAAV